MGRTGELTRILDHLGDEVVFLICGVAGIGKTELAIRAIECIEARPAWRNARFLDVAVPPGAHPSHAIARLRLASGAVGRAEAASLEDALAPVVAALDAVPTVVRLDDLHHLTDDEAGRMLGYLTRHLRTSCVIATSRRALPLPPSCPTACVIRLTPLADGDAHRMVALLAELLGLPELNAAAVVGRAGGSPFYLQHEVAALPDSRRRDADVLEESLAQLDDDARRALIRVATLTGPGPVAAVGADLGGEPTLGRLARRFLVELTDGVVRAHDLVRTTILRVTGPDDRRDAHRWAADRHRAWLADDPAAHAMHAVEVIRHLRAAGDRDPALGFMLAHHRAIARAGLDHLLLESLTDLRGGGPERDFAIELARGQVYLRQSRVAEARAIVVAHADDPRAAASQPYLNLASAVAMRAGDLDAVERALVAARALVASPGARRRLTLAMADLTSIRGAGADARALLGDPDAVGGATTASGRARWQRSLVISLIFEQRHAEASAAAGGYRRARTGQAGDLDVQIAMLEVVALAELGEADDCRALIDDVIAPAARAGALREKAAEFYVGLAAWAAGALVDARRAFERVRAYLIASCDAVLAGIVGHYLGRTLLALGDADAAHRLLAETAHRAAQFGIGQAPLGRIYAADALLALGRVDEADAILTEVVTGPLTDPARRLAHRTLARVAAARGEIAALHDHLEAAARIGPVTAADQRALALARVELSFGTSDPAAVRMLHAALSHYAARGARFDEARAALALATVHAIAGGPGDRVIAGQALARVRALIDVGGYRGLAVRAVVLDAALAAGSGRRPEAEARLGAALAGCEHTDQAAIALLASALDGVARPDLRPDQRGLLAALRLIAPAATCSDLVVDRSTGTIASATGVTVRGRSLLCDLLVRFVEADGAAIGPAALYCAVWSTAEYHPLRHRNTLYAAVNRLRRLLGELVPDRPALIVTTREGWQLSAERLTVQIVRDSDRPRAQDDARPAADRAAVPGPP